VRREAGEPSPSTSHLSSLASAAAGGARARQPCRRPSSLAGVASAARPPLPCSMAGVASADGDSTTAKSGTRPGALRAPCPSRRRPLPPRCAPHRRGGGAQSPMVRCQIPAAGRQSSLRGLLRRPRGGAAPPPSISAPPSPARQVRNRGARRCGGAARRAPPLNLRRRSMTGAAQ
jgi:hypothetical protein